MSTTFDQKAAELSEELKAELGTVELKTMQYTLADAIREGSRNTTQTHNWGNGNTACALSAAVIAGKARGWL